MEARGGMSAAVSWMDANLDVQGYCLSREESRRLRWGQLERVAAGRGVRGQLRRTAEVAETVVPDQVCIPSTLLGIWWRRRGVPAPSDVSQAT
jgi:hypothetical protein